MDTDTKTIIKPSMELTDIRLRSIVRFDPISKTFEQCQSLKYLRSPSQLEYPLDLTRGYDEYVHREGVYPGPFDQVKHYLMHVDQTKQMLQDADFILRRRTLRLFMEAGPVNKFTKKYRFEAFRLRGCIFVKLLDDDEQEATLRGSYAYKTRQYLLADRPGGVSDTEAPIDEREQHYGMYTARIGEFRLLFGAEVTGLANSNPVGDLTDQDELDKCRLVSIRVVKETIDWRNSFHYFNWVRQAYLSGVDKLVVASFDENGQVVRPIEVQSIKNLVKRKGLGIGRRCQGIHQFLEQISSKLEDLDSSAASVKFQLMGKSLTFEEVLDTEFIDYVNQM